MKKQKNLWVVDLGEKLTKITKGFATENGLLHIGKFWIEETPKDVFEEDHAQINVKLGVLLRSLLKEHKNKDDLLLLLNHKNMVTASYTFPMMTINEVEEAIKWKMQVLLSEDFDNWRVDFLAKERIERFEYLGIDDKKLDVLGIGVKKEVLSAYCKVFKRTRHVLKSVEPQFHSLSSMLDEDQNTPTLIIDIGRSSTRLFYYVERFLIEVQRVELEDGYDGEMYLQQVIKVILDSFQSPLGFAKGYKNGNVCVMGGESLHSGVLNYLERYINKEIKPTYLVLAEKQNLQFSREMTKEELCLLTPCICGMLKRYQTIRSGPENEK